MLRFASLVLVLLAALPAQSARRTGHPQDRPHVGTGQTVPFGADVSFCAGRSQLLIPAQYLPGPGAVLLGLEATSLTAGAVTYQSLRIRMSPVSPNAIPAPVFDVNLPQPTTVFQATNLPVVWQAGVWQTFTASQPYLHDGVSSLTIDIQKLATPGYAGDCSGLYRPDLPTMLIAFGGASSGAHLATQARLQTIPIDVRLLWGGVPTLHLGSTPPSNGHHGFAIGSNFDVVVEGTPLSLLVCQIGLGLQPPVNLPPIVGEWRLGGAGLTLPMAPVSAQGRSLLSVPIPLDPNLVGLYLAFQGVTYEFGSGVLRVTNATDCFVGA